MTVPPTDPRPSSAGVVGVSRRLLCGLLVTILGGCAGGTPRGASVVPPTVPEAVESPVETTAVPRAAPGTGVETPTVERPEDASPPPAPETSRAQRTPPHPSPHTAPQTPEATPQTSTPGPRRFVLQLDRGAASEAIEIAVEPGRDAVELGRAVEIGGARLTAERFAARILLRESIEKATFRQPGFPATHLLVQRGGQRSAAWLVPGSPVLGRSISPVAYVELVPAVSPLEFLDLEGTLRAVYRPGPKILVEHRSGGRRDIIPVRVGVPLATSRPGYTLEVVRSFKSFSMDLGSGRPFDDPGGRPNPALEVRVSGPGGPRTAWLFALLPEFSREAEDAVARLRFIDPAAASRGGRADVTVVDSSGGTFAVFASVSGEFHRVDAPLRESVRIGDLELMFATRLENAQVVQRVETGPGGRPAVLVTWEAGGRAGERWVPLGVPQEIHVDRGEAIVARLIDGAPHGGHGLPGGERELPAGHPPVPPR